MAHEPWKDNERTFYEENRKAVDRNVMIRLGKKIMQMENANYSSVGDYISDLLLKEIHIMDSRIEFDEQSPTIAHYMRREIAKKAAAK